MKFHKILFCIFLLIFSYIFPVYADDEDSEISSDISSINVSSEISAEPSINSRSAIIYERSSGTILFGKNEKSRCRILLKPLCWYDTIFLRKAHDRGGSLPSLMTVYWNT